MRKILLLALLAASSARAAVPSVTSSSGPYACNGSTKAFVIGFPYQASSWIVVQRRDLATGTVATLVQGGDYTVAPGAGSSGTVTLVSGVRCPTGSTLTIKRATPRTQPTSLPSSGPTNPKAIETMVDRTTEALQDHVRDQTDRDAAQDAAIAQGSAGGSSTMVQATGGGLSRTAADWAALGPVSASSTTVAAKGTSRPRSLEERVNDVVVANDRGADPAYDGTTNQAAFQQAADDLGARGGGELIALPGTYKIRGTISLPSHVRFSGAHAVELVQEKGSSALVLVDAKTDVTVEDLILTGVGSGDSTATVTNASYYNASPTNQAFGVWTRGVSRVRVRGNVITNMRGAGVFNWKPVADLWVEDNRISGTYPEAGLPAGDGNYAQFGVCIEQSDQMGALPVIGDRIYVRGNHIDKVAHAVFAAPGFDHLLIEGNFWTNLQQHGFYVYPTSNLQIRGNRGDSYVGSKVQALPGNTKMNPYAISVEGNILTSDAAPALQVLVSDEVSGSTNIRSSIYLDGVTISGNILSSTNHSGMQLTSVRRALVVGNQIRSAAKAGIYTYQVDGRFEGNLINDACSTLEPVNLGVASFHTVIFRGNTITNTRAGCLSYITAAWNASLGPPIAWAASKYHGTGVYASNGANVYKASAGGNSASSGGPTGTGTAIADGSDGLLWDYVSTLTSVDRGTIILDSNYVGSTVSEPTNSFVVGGTNLVLRGNRLPFTGKTISINATLISLEDDGTSVHAGWAAGSPYFTGGVVSPGKPGREFMADAIPAANCAAPYQRRDRIWNVSPAAGGAAFWVCVAVGSPWKAVNVAP
jgi:hypothetical protein